MVLLKSITPGNVDDRKPVLDLVRGLFGKVFGDRGYSVLQQAVLEMEEWPSAIDF